MKDFVNTEYQIHTKKLVHAPEIRLCFITDLHGKSYGPGNTRLLEAVDKVRPDVILISGDQLTWNVPESVPVAKKTTEALSKLAPVCYSLGNHEKRLDLLDSSGEEDPLDMAEKYREYMQSVREAGVHVLDNGLKELSVRGERLMVYGLTIPQECYHKPFPRRLEKEFLREKLPERKEECYSILLAHNPVFGDRYFEWGADLTLSGHFHGGVIRFGPHVGAISPQLRPFPPYCCGDFYRDRQAMIVSTGMGEHQMPIRINAPRELITIRLLGG